MIQTVITFYLGPVHSVKNLRKVRVECTGGGEGKKTTQVYARYGLKISQNNWIKMRQKTKSVHRARGKLILYSTATKPIAVCPR